MFIEKYNITTCLYFQKTKVAENEQLARGGRWGVEMIGIFIKPRGDSTRLDSAYHRCHHCKKKKKSKNSLISVSFILHLSYAYICMHTSVTNATPPSISAPPARAFQKQRYGQTPLRYSPSFAPTPPRLSERVGELQHAGAQREKKVSSSRGRFFSWH